MVTAQEIDVTGRAKRRKGKLVKKYKNIYKKEKRIKNSDWL